MSLVKLPTLATDHGKNEFGFYLHECHVGPYPKEPKNIPVFTSAEDRFNPCSQLLILPQIQRL
jgi:hypothetical protein